MHECDGEVGGARVCHCHTYDKKRGTNFNSPTCGFYQVASSDRLVIRCDETWTRFVQYWFHIVRKAVGGFPQYSIRITKHER